MRRDTDHRLRKHGAGLKVRALVAVATAVFGIGAGVILIAGPAGAATAMTFGTAPAATATAGVQQTIVVDGAGSGDSVVLNVTGTPSTPVVTGNVATANSSGVATFSAFVIQTAGSYTIVAHDSTNNSTYSDTAGVAQTVSAAAAAKLEFHTNPPASTTGSFTMAVAVTDAFGNTVTSNTDSIQVAVSPNTCTTTGTNPVSAVSGIATFSLTLTAGQNCVFTASDLTAGDTSFTTAQSTAISLLGAPTKLVFTTQPPSAATYGTAMASFAVSVEDANGNVEVGNTGSTDTIELTPSAGCTTTGTLQVGAINGVATFTGIGFTGTASVSCSFSATDMTTANITPATSTSIAVSSTAPAKLGFSVEPPTTAVVGIALSAFKVSTEEGNGTVITAGANTADTVTLTSTCKLAGTTSAVEIAGTATFTNVVVQSTGSCTLVASDVTSSLIASSTSTAILVAAGAPTHVAFTTPPPTTFGSLTTPLTAFKVSVEDVYGNVTATSLGSTDNIQITSTNCTLTGTTTVAAVAGVATFSAVTITTPGACVLTATDLSRPMTTAQASVQVGQPQPTLVVSSTKGFFKTPLRLTTTGGAGSGAVTFSVANGTAKGCAIVNGALTSTSEGTCLVTATKAASGNYAQATSATTTVTIGAQLLRAYRVVGPVFMGRRMVIRVAGVGFFGAPRVISNTAGFSARVEHDSGTLLTILITSSPRNRVGIHVLVIIEPNGRRTALRFMLRA